MEIIKKQECKKVLLHIEEELDPPNYETELRLMEILNADTIFKIDLESVYYKDEVNTVYVYKVKYVEN